MLSSEKFPPKRAAIIGCTGMAGRNLVLALEKHPWFQITSLHGSKNVNKPYRELIRTSVGTLSETVLNLNVSTIDDLERNIDSIDVIFSAIPSENAKEIEGRLAAYKPVISTAAAYRYEPDVPILLPVINGNHYKSIICQQKQRNWKGFICTGPNCTTVGLAVALAPIIRKYGLSTVHLVSMQAISGAGYPGVSSYDILGNVVPFIKDEENKVKLEIKKILADPSDEDDDFALIYPNFIVEAKCNRVPVITGHTLSVFFQTKTNTDVNDIKNSLRNFEGFTKSLNLPHNPEPVIYLFDSDCPDRPQPRIEFSSQKSGLTTFIGGLESTAFENGFKMTILSNNLELGAGSGAVLNAEYLLKQGLI
ncbi:MAG: aspartate-semialdehyde dehydrogenase [Promethearchaeota archaeon]